LKIKGWICLLLLMGVFTGCQAEPPKESDSLTRVGIIEAQIKTLEIVKSYAGVVAYAEETLLSFRMTGEIETFFYQENDRVNEGDLLAVINPIGYASQIEGAKRDYDSTLNQVNQARDQRDYLLTQYRNFEELYASGSISKIALDEIELQYENASEAYASALSQMNKARTYYEETARAEGNYELVAPREGLVARIFFEPDEVVPAGTPVLAFAQTGTHVKIHAGSEEIHEIKRHDKMQVQYGDKTLEGRVVAIASAPDAVTLEYEVTILLESQIPLGQVVRVEKTKESHTGLVLPIYAVLAEGGNFYVFTLDEEGIAHQRPVKIRYSVDNQVVIEGISPGEKVIYEGNHLINDQDAVKVREQDVLP